MQLALCPNTYLQFCTISIIAEKSVSPFLLQFWNPITLEYLQTQCMLTHPPPVNLHVCQSFCVWKTLCTWCLPSYFFFYNLSASFSPKIVASLAERFYGENPFQDFPIPAHWPVVGLCICFHLPQGNIFLMMDNQDINLWI